MQINATITQSAAYGADYYSMRYSLASMVGMATTFFRYFLFHVMASHFLSSSEDEIGQLLEEKDLQCIIKQLSNSVFVICKITSTLIIPHITKTLSNNCLLYIFKFFC